MSNLLSQASLVMIPSGYKEDTVYSPVPTNGNGDLSFTRASNGTRVNSAGLVEDVAWNLLQQSETLLSPWSTSEVAYVTGQTDPNGTTTAIKIVASATTDFHYTQQPITKVNGAFYTMVVYAKSSGLNTCRIALSGGDYGDVNFSANTITFTNATGSIEDVGNGWKKITIVATADSTSESIYLLLGTGSFTGNGTDGVTFWHPQVNIGSTAKPYFPTTDRLNVPRLTYQNGGGGCPSLLLEKQSTNISTQSTITSFGSGTNDWYNESNNPASINQTTGIDGTQNGAKYTKTAGQTTNEFLYKNQIPVTSGTTYTVSGYIKLGTASNAVIVINNSNAWNTVANGNIVCSTANGFSTTAWKRFELTITGPASNKINIHYGYHQETGVAAQADGTFFLDGLQVEASSYATSLINTTSSSATRVADACFKTGISSLIGQTEGVLFADFYYNLANNTPSGNDKGIMTIRPNGGSYNNEIALIYYGDEGGSFGKTIQATVTVGGVTQCNLKTPQTLTNGYYKVAFAYKQNDFAFYVNGVQIATDTSGSVPTCDELYLVDPLRINPNTTIKEVILFPTRLTNAELASLTTI
jgi:hypothetical protein